MVDREKDFPYLEDDKVRYTPYHTLSKEREAFFATDFYQKSLKPLIDAVLRLGKRFQKKEGAVEEEQPKEREETENKKAYQEDQETAYALALLALKLEALLQAAYLLNIQTLCNIERAGKGKDWEANIRNVLKLASIRANDDVLYGVSIQPVIRMRWEQQGIDPHSEDKVLHFISQYNPQKLRQFFPEVLEEEDLRHKSSSTPEALIHRFFPSETEAPSQKQKAPKKR